MKRNPLFLRTISALQQSALTEFRATELGQLVGRLKRVGRGTSANELSRLQIDLKRYARSGGLERQLKSSAMYRTLEDVQRYARGGIKETLLEGLFQSLGPIGGLLQALLRPRGQRIADLNKELEAAANMLELFGYGVTRPGRPSAPSSQSQRSLSKSGVDQARRQLEELGFTIIPPGEERSRPPTLPTEQSSAPASRTGSMPRDILRPVPEKPDSVSVVLDGQRFTIKRDNPLLTGKMVRVSSSNVHSIGFIWNDAVPREGTLKVRFLDKRQDGPASGRGALYYYYDVSPKMFLAFSRAASKGKWVWDHLRIRGTVSGHKKEYALMGLASDAYVPRKATRLGDEEWYLPREVQAPTRTTRAGNLQLGGTYRSELGAQFVQKVNRARAQGPNRARPQRGR